MLSELQKHTAQSIVNIYETGNILGDYGCVTVIENDPGHLTYGRSQTTLASGNLYSLIKQYCEEADARFAKRLRQWLPQLQAKNFVLDTDKKLHNVLRAASDDRAMRRAQDSFFDSCYWASAAQAAQRAGISCALGVAVVYDSTVHGSWDFIRKRTHQQGAIDAIGEHDWIRNYVRTRREWLANHANAVLRKTTYRMDAFQAMLDMNNWNLDLPLVVCGAEISTVTLDASPPPNCYDGPESGSRTLDAKQSPLPRGLDVRLVQLALSDWGANVKADGIFGPGTALTLSNYQKAKGLPGSGVADRDLIKDMAATCY